MLELINDERKWMAEMTEERREGLNGCGNGLIKGYIKS